MGTLVFVSVSFKCNNVFLVCFLFRFLLVHAYTRELTPPPLTCAGQRRSAIQTRRTTFFSAFGSGPQAVRAPFHRF